jgi:hypothetical protein
MKCGDTKTEAAIDKQIAVLKKQFQSAKTEFPVVLIKFFQFFCRLALDFIKLNQQAFSAQKKYSGRNGIFLLKSFQNLNTNWTPPVPQTQFQI